MTMYSLYEGLLKIIIIQQTNGWRYQVLDGSARVGEGDGYIEKKYAESVGRSVAKQVIKERKMIEKLYAASL